MACVSSPCSSYPTFNFPAFSVSVLLPPSLHIHIYVHTHTYTCSPHSLDPERYVPHVPVPSDLCPMSPCILVICVPFSVSSESCISHVCCPLSPCVPTHCISSFILCFPHLGAILCSHDHSSCALMPLWPRACVLQILCFIFCGLNDQCPVFQIPSPYVQSLPTSESPSCVTCPMTLQTAVQCHMSLSPQAPCPDLYPISSVLLSHVSVLCVCASMSNILYLSTHCVLVSLMSPCPCVPCLSSSVPMPLALTLSHVLCFPSPHL